MTTKQTQTELLEDLALLLRHRDVAHMLQEQRLIEVRSEAQRRWNEEQREKRREVVVTDDARPSEFSIYSKMSDQELILAIAKMKDAANQDGDFSKVRIMESLLNERRLEKQRQMLKSGAESMTAFQR